MIYHNFCIINGICLIASISRLYEMNVGQILNVVPSIEELNRQSSKNVKKCYICKKSFQGDAAMKTHLQRSHNKIEVCINIVRCRI